MANRRILLAGEDEHEFGIIGVANTYGTVISVGTTQKADEYVFEDNVGDAAAVLLHNHTIEVEFEVLFKSAATVLAIGDQIAIPGGSLQGNITQIKDERKTKQGRKITFTAKHWLSLGNVTPVDLLD